MIEYRNSQIKAVIEEWIHDERHQMILIDRLVRGLTYEQISELHYMSVSQVKRIIYKGQERVFKHMNLS